jgi:hypothetical protein
MGLQEARPRADVVEHENRGEGAAPTLNLANLLY